MHKITSILGQMVDLASFPICLGAINTRQTKDQRCGYMGAKDNNMICCQ